LFLVNKSKDKKNRMRVLGIPSVAGTGCELVCETVPDPVVECPVVGAEKCYVFI
jgi:hypothetical protein